MRANTPARSEQPKPQSSVQRFPLFARAGAASADLWLAHAPLSAADFRDLRFRNLLSGLTYDLEDEARRVAFNAAFAGRIAAGIAEQSGAEVWSARVNTQQADANEQLVIAAPALLAAAREAEAILSSGRWIEGSKDPEAVALWKLRAALAKATGVSHG